MPVVVVGLAFVPLLEEDFHQLFIFLAFQLHHLLQQTHAVAGLALGVGHHHHRRVPERTHRAVKVRLLAIVVATDIVAIVVSKVLLVDVSPVGHRLTVAGHSGPFLRYFFLIFLKVSQFEDGRGAPALNQVLASV